MTAANETQTLGSIRASETCISSQRASSCRGWENSDQVCPRPAAELRSAGHPRRLYPHWLVGKLISLFYWFLPPLGAECAIDRRPTIKIQLESVTILGFGLEENVFIVAESRATGGRLW